MTNEHPEDARARRMAEVRALRGSPERLQQIADLAYQRRQTKSRSTSSASGRKTPENSSHMFGHPWPLWFQMRDVAYEYLCKCASERRMTSYGELWNAINSAIGEDLGSHWRQLPHLLGDVSEHTFTELELIPTALVVSQDGDDEPGPGFFRIAATLGALAEGESPPEGVDWRMTDSQRAYWQQNVSGMFQRFATN